LIDLRLKLGTLIATLLNEYTYMSVFTDEDTQTVRSLALTFGGFIGLTVVLVVLAILIS